MLCSNLQISTPVVKIFKKLPSFRKSYLLLFIIISIHHIVNIAFGFDLLPIVKFALLLDCGIKEITCSPMICRCYAIRFLGLFPS